MSSSNTENSIHSYQRTTLKHNHHSKASQSLARPKLRPLPISLARFFVRLFARRIRHKSQLSHNSASNNTHSLTIVTKVIEPQIHKKENNSKHPSAQQNSNYYAPSDVFAEWKTTSKNASPLSYNDKFMLFTNDDIRGPKSSIEDMPYKSKINSTNKPRGIERFRGAMHRVIQKRSQSVRLPRRVHKVHPI